MISTRQNKVSRLLQKELGTYFQQEGLSQFGRALITVTTVRISPDLSVASVYLSLYLADDKKKLMGHINEMTREIRGKVGAKVKNQLRIIPHFNFYIDDSLDYAENIEKLLES